MKLDDYQQRGFVSYQIHQIKLGLDAGLDVTIYAKNEFDWTQMEQIRLGLTEGIDVSIYALPNIPAAEMEHIREKIRYKNEDNPTTITTIIKGSKAKIISFNNVNIHSGCTTLVYALAKKCNELGYKA
ncbi:MAG: hypothetical protein RR421_05385, partial [Cetobacterium sp.]